MQRQKVCDHAARYYYLLSNAASARVVSEVCPSNADCFAGGQMAPVPLKGYWVDRTSYK